MRDFKAGYKLMGLCCATLAVLLLAAFLCKVYENVMVSTSVVKSGVVESDSDLVKLNKIASYIKSNTQLKDSGLSRRMLTQFDYFAVLDTLSSDCGNCREVAVTIKRLAEAAGVDTSDLRVIYANIDYTDDSYSMYNAKHAALKYKDCVVDICIDAGLVVSWFDSTDAWLAECRLH